MESIGKFEEKYQRKPPVEGLVFAWMIFFEEHSLIYHRHTRPWPVFCKQQQQGNLVKYYWSSQASIFPYRAIKIHITKSSLHVTSILNWIEFATDSLPSSLLKWKSLNLEWEVKCTCVAILSFLKEAVFLFFVKNRVWCKDTSSHCFTNVAESGTSERQFLQLKTSIMLCIYYYFYFYPQM